MIVNGKEYRLEQTVVCHSHIGLHGTCNTSITIVPQDVIIKHYSVNCPDFDGYTICPVCKSTVDVPMHWFEPVEVNSND